MFELVEIWVCVVVVVGCDFVVVVVEVCGVVEWDVEV